MKEAPWLAKNTYASASSTGCPALFKAVLEPNLEISLAVKVDGIKGVQIGPGATAFTLIPFGANIRARDLVKEVNAPLVAE